MKIFTKKNKSKSAFKSFLSSSKRQKKESSNILRVTKSIILNKSIISNSIIQAHNNYNLNNSINKSETIIPLSENRTLFNKGYTLNMLKYNNNSNEDSTNNSAFNNNSFILLNLNKALNKKSNSKKIFYYCLKQKKKNSKDKNESKDNKQKIYLKFKQKINDFQRDNNSIKVSNKSYINLKNNYDSLFIDFFYKWYKNNTINQGIKTIINKQYSNLVYNENEIFYYDFSDFIHNKINEFKKNTIQNLLDKKQSIFHDINNKEIKLTLLGMKLTFIPQNKKSKNIILYLPFTYSILFYYKGINFFREILLSIIHFNNNDYDDISINYDEINCFIHKNVNASDENLTNDNNKYLRLYTKKITRKKTKSNSLIKRKSDIFLGKKKIKIDKQLRAIFAKDNINNKHSNLKINEEFKGYKSYILNNNKHILSLHSNSEKNDNNFFYNSYCFIWETPLISYKLVLEMPKLIFKYQDLSQNINIFCHKNMMLFLLKNNFINWDFYLMNYLFSIKSFRKILLDNYAYKSSLDITKNTQKENICINKYNDKQSNKHLEVKLWKNSEYLEDYFINSSFPKPQFNEKNEQFYFFYTNISNINCLIFFNSYKILIDCDKINPNLSWEYYLNFKQMKFLIEIKKYEILEDFLQKAIKTNNEKRSLSLDFTVFEELDPNIMNYQKKEIIVPYNIESKKINLWRSFRKPKKELILNIHNPSITIEKYFQENKWNNENDNDNINKELNDDFLKKINKQKMKFWSKNIIDYIEEQHLIYNDKIAQSSLVKKGNFKKRIKRRSSTVIVPSNNSDKTDLWK